MTLQLGTLVFDKANYRFTEKDDNPNYSIRIDRGCGDNAFPVVQQFKHIYTIRPYEFCSLGSTIDEAIQNRDALLAQVKAASTKGNPPVYLIRTVPGQFETAPDVWTVLGGVPKRVRQHWDGIYKIWSAIDLYVFPGQRIPAGVS